MAASLCGSTSKPLRQISAARPLQASEVGKYSEDAIARRDHLAGQHNTVRRFRLVQRVLDVIIAEVIAAAFGAALAAHTPSEQSIGRLILLEERGIKHLFARRIR